MAIQIDIYYHTDYDNDSLPVSAPEVMLNAPLTEDSLPKLENENYLFQGWYSTPTFEPESKVTVGTIVTDIELHLYAKWTPKNEWNSKMTLLADEIRELSGTTETMGLDAMATNVAEANGLVDSEAELITQIATALEGKTASGNATYDTCIVEITADQGVSIERIAYTTVNDGVIEPVVLDPTGLLPLNLTCLCNSIIIIVSDAQWHNLSNAAYVGWISNSFCKIYSPTTSNGETTIIHLTGVSSDN